MSVKFLEILSQVNDSDFEEIVEAINKAEVHLKRLRAILPIVAAQCGKSHLMPPKHGGRRVKKPVAAGTGSQRAGSTSESWQDAAEDADQDDLAAQLRPPAGVTKTEHYRQVVKRYLQANGPQLTHKICKQTGIPNGSITAVLNNPMFVKTAIGYGLTANHK